MKKSYSMNSYYNAQFRLQGYRQKAEAHNAKHVGAALTWRHYAQYAHHLTKAPTLTRREGKMFADSLDDLPGAIVQNGKDSTARDACGYYADHYQDATIYGAVLKVRSSRGMYYVPVTWCTGWDGVTAFFDDVEHVEKGADDYEHEKAEREAIRSARYYAEHEAEEAREFAAKEQAETDIQNARDEIHELNKVGLPLLRDLRKGHGKTPAILEAMNYRIWDILAARAKAFKTIEERTNNFWSAVEF